MPPHEIPVGSEERLIKTLTVEGEDPGLEWIDDDLTFDAVMPQ
jgi:hypothetical protein